MVGERAEELIQEIGVRGMDFDTIEACLHRTHRRIRELLDREFDISLGHLCARNGVTQSSRSFADDHAARRPWNQAGNLAICCAACMSELNERDLTIILDKTRKTRKPFDHIGSCQRNLAWRCLSARRNKAMLNDDHIEHGVFSARGVELDQLIGNHAVRFRFVASSRCLHDLARENTFHHFVANFAHSASFLLTNIYRGSTSFRGALLESCFSFP